MRTWHIALAAAAVVVAAIGAVPSAAAPDTKGALLPDSTKGAPPPDSIVSLDTAIDSGNGLDMVLDAAGHPVISYYDATNGDLKVLHCTNPDCSGTQSAETPDPASTTEDVGAFTAIELDSAGNPVVAYLGDGGFGIKVIACTNPTCSGAQTAATPETTATGELSMELDAADYPVIAFGNGSDLGLLHCSNVACSHGQFAETVDSSGMTGGYPSLTLDADGNPIVSYFFFGSGDLLVVHCDDPNCVAPEAPVTVDDAVDAGLESSIALDDAGNPVISYYQGNEGMWLLHCTNPDCTAPQVGTQQDVGLSTFTSLVLDASGNPVVAHFNQDSADLGILRCNDPACAGDDELSFSPDSAGDVGRASVLALDAGGRPVVAYRDATNGDLKLLHCYDPATGCAGVPGGPTVEIPEACGFAFEGANVIVGTARGEPLVGTGGSDVIVAKGGADLVDGKGGVDCVLGGRGADIIRGGRGADLLLGGKGRDTLLGGRGRDTCRSGSAADRSCERT